VMGVPLAWLQLTREKRRLFAAIAGIAFAVVLMMMQLGFRDALYKSVTKVPDRLQGDLVLISPQYEYLFATKTLTQRRLYQALAVEGVKSVAPLYLGMANWKHPVTHVERFILVLGFNPKDNVISVPGLSEYLDQIKRPDVVLFDADSRAEFGPVAELFRSQGKVVTELNGRKVEVAGLFELGPSFGANGHLIASDLTFLRLFGDRRQGLVDLGLISLQPGADPVLVQAQLRKLYPPDVEVLTREGFVARERNYWDANAPIGFVFNLGALMGLIVGSVIVYQILYTDVTDHLAEYATLKAMGHADSYLFGIVIQEAMILSILGSIPGISISTGLYLFAHEATRLPIEITTDRIIIVYLLTLGMCATSGILAMRKLRKADPAEIF